MSYPAGSLPRISGTFLDGTGAPVDLTSVALTVWSPSGAGTAYTTTIVRDSAGVYHQDVPVPAPGIYTYRWSGTSTGTSYAVEGSITVDPIPVTPGPSPLDLTSLENVKLALNFQSPPAPKSIDSSDATLQRMITALSRSMLSLMNRTGWQAYTANETRNGTGTQRMVLKEWPVLCVNSVGINNSAVPAQLNGLSGGWSTDGFSVMLGGTNTPGFVFPFAGAAYFYRGFQNVVLNYTRGLVDQGGTCSVNGTAVTSVGGTGFAPFLAGSNVLINGTAYGVSTYVSPTQITLAASAGVIPLATWCSALPLGDVEQACIEYVTYRYKRQEHIDLDSLVAAPGQSTNYRKKAIPEEVQLVIDRYRLVPVMDI